LTNVDGAIVWKATLGLRKVRVDGETTYEWFAFINTKELFEIMKDAREKFDDDYEFLGFCSTGVGKLELMKHLILNNVDFVMSEEEEQDDLLRRWDDG